MFPDNSYPDVDVDALGSEGTVETALEDGQAPTSSEGTQDTTPVQPQFNPDEWALNYKGQPIKPKDRQHLINLAQQGYGYSQAMEKLNKEKEQIAAAKTQYDKYAQLDQRFQRDPEFRKKMEQLFANGGQTTEQSQQNQPTLPPEVMDKLSKFEQFQESVKQEKADENLRKEIDQLKADHPDNWDFDDGEGTLVNKILRHALDNNFPNLKSAYRDFMWDKRTVDTKAQALKAENDKKIADAKAGKVMAPGQKPPKTTTPINFKQTSYNDLKDMALKELGA